HGAVCAQSATHATNTDLPPQAPAWLTVPDIDEDHDGNIPLSWAATQDAVRYVIYRLQDGISELKSVNAPATSAEVTLAEGQHELAITACDAASCSEEMTLGSNPVLVKRRPAAPTDVPVLSSGTTTTGEVGLTWTAAADPTVQFYIVDIYKNSALLRSEESQSASASLSGLEHSGTSGYTSYSFRVRHCKHYDGDPLCSEAGPTSATLKSGNKAPAVTKLNNPTSVTSSSFRFTLEPDLRNPAELIVEESLDASFANPRDIDLYQHC